ncbi:DUF3108 domain-containing protein [Paracraurococcus ruber]|uniref:DUF3108 domain-containing protein n=1 Tax=Paracraurococcus ruber TaxID=77675 RepID=A0ABS1CWR2_9PROT|nr:DUF3108 domain-containing protein [Paracraurococcus ruber]MBK1658965.1 hypothetical protein [Paracraurococcus ruber]TDG28821.1 DUF3108 domain-containing protein [Paracraurococcus ruber]
MSPIRLLLPAALLALAPAPSQAEPLRARYEVRAAGLQVMEVEATFDLDGPRYRVVTRIRTTGLAGVFSSGDQLTSAEGRWRGAEPVPAHYRVDGTWRGGRRQVVMDWPTPGRPVLSALEPPNETDREPVPEALRLGTMDALSALAKLTRTVAQTGRCDAGAQVYDGRRRADYSVQTVGLEALPAGGAFGGEALRCAFESRLLAGRRGDQDPEQAAKPQPATAWMARPLPDRIAIPVRIEMPSRWFGTIRVMLTAVEPLRSGQEVAQGRQ